MCGFTVTYSDSPQPVIIITIYLFCATAGVAVVVVEQFNIFFAVRQTRLWFVMGNSRQHIALDINK